MIRSENHRSTFLLALSLFFLLSMGLSTCCNVRHFTLATMSPAIHLLSWTKGSLHTLATLPLTASIPTEEIDSLKRENFQLKREIEALNHKSTAKAVSAEVVFRAPTSWGSSFWINAGSQTDEEIVRKNSPVVVGTAIIGVIEEVHSNRSRVRLITDASLKPSVRVKRDNLFLAKGELRGNSSPLWRGKRLTLEGVGFCCDFADEKGPQRDLRTGQHILLVGDRLITTGMDGVFPPGLDVATVTRIHPLREGDYYYNLEATPAAENLDRLRFVEVLPPY